MIGRILRGCGGIRCGIETEMKAQGLVLAGGDIGQRSVQTTALSVHPSDVPRQLQPGAVGLLQSEAAEEETTARDGEGLTGGIGIAERIEQQRFSARRQADVEAQRGRAGGGGEKQGRHELTKNKGGTTEGHELET